MGSLSFTINGHPPTPNTTRRWHFHRRSDEAAIWRRAAFYAAKAGSWVGDPFPEDPIVSVSVTFRYKNRRLRDLDNLCASLKPVLDGMVDAGIVKDDDSRHIRALTVTEECPSGYDDIYVMVTDMTELYR